MVRIIASGVGNLSTDFSVSRTFRLRRIGQHLSHSSRDLATLTLELKVTALVGDAGFCLCAKFEAHRPSCLENIAHLLCEHRSWPLNFWPLTSFTNYSSVVPILCFLGLSVLQLGRGMWQTDRRTDTASPFPTGRGHNNNTSSSRSK